MEFFRFGHPVWLRLLWFIPVFLAVVIYSWVQFRLFEKELRRKPYLYQKNLPPWRRRVAKAIFYALGLSFIAIALADPYYKKTVADNIYRGVRLYVLFDVSRSMQMAEDVKPNRLEAAKNELKKAYQYFNGSYEIALIPFANIANATYYPPSFDSVNFYFALNNLDRDTIGVPGTDIAAAFQALNQLVEKFGLRSDTVNVVILLSDGGQEENFSVNRSNLRKEIQPLLKDGFYIYTIGVGGLKPTPMILRDWEGNFRGYFIDQKTGKTYTSRLDESILKSIAKMGRGKYCRFEKGGELQAAIKDIIEENGRLAEKRYHYEDASIRLWFFVSGILIFLLGEISLVSFGLNFKSTNIKPR